MTTAPDREIEGEVTRVEAVRYLQGATGHAVGSLGLLAVGVVGVWTTGRPEFGVGALVSAWLLSMNGLSLFAWDRIRDHVHATVGETEEVGPERTLTGPSISTEQKAEMLSSLVQVLVLVAIVFGSIELFVLLGIRTGAYVLGGLLAVGNAGVLLYARLSPADDE